MLAAALFWLSVLSLLVGICVVLHGFYLISNDRRMRSKDSRLGLRFVSLGSAIVVIASAATFWRF